MSEEVYDALIVGAGPAGLMAGAAAGARGKKVVVMEKMLSPGRKLLMTGNGRCNLTHTGDVDFFIGNFSKTGIFLKNSFSAFFNRELRNLFENMGVGLCEEEGGKIYPKSCSARDILRALTVVAEKNGAVIRCGKEVSEIVVEDGRAKGVITAGGERFFANSVVIATGGVSYPGTGSTGKGLEIARRHGHTVTDLRPGLVPLYSGGVNLKPLQGVSLREVQATLFLEDRKDKCETGDLLFTHFGLSGPVILNLSADAYDLLKVGRDVSLAINFTPGIKAEEYDKLLLKSLSDNPGKNVKNVFKNFFPERFASFFVSACGIDGGKSANQVTKEERLKMAAALSDFRIRISGTGGFDEAMITRGGVAVSEVNPKTMESKIVKGLFFAGEVLDIDAKTGGYNLQAAFSTGYAAGSSICVPP